jgi:hypothetical protein
VVPHDPSLKRLTDILRKGTCSDQAFRRYSTFAHKPVREGCPKKTAGLPQGSGLISLSSAETAPVWARADLKNL